MIRQIHDRIVEMALAHGLTIVENKESIQKVVSIAIERIKSPLADQFFEVSGDSFAQSASETR